MSSAEYLREFVNERLTAAAEEIFGVFKTAIVQYEQEIDRQRKLLDIVWKPEIKLHRIEIPQQHECKEEEVHAEQQLSNKDCNSSVIQKEPEPPQIKEEQEELCCIQRAERHVIHTFMLSSPYEESDQHESELKSDHKFLSYNFYTAESQEHKKRGKHEDSGSTRDAELKPKKRPCKSHSNDAHNPGLSENQPEDDAPDTISKYCTIKKPVSGEGKQSPQPLCSHHITSQHVESQRVESLSLKLGTTAAALVSKPNVTSPVWKHFGFEPNERGEPANLDQPVCKICARKVPSKQGNTTNMIAHLDTHHRAIKALLPPKAPRGSLYVDSYQ